MDTAQTDAAARSREQAPTREQAWLGEEAPAGQIAAVAAACELLGDRWSLPIVAALLDGPLRYTEIQEQLPALAPNILTARLRKLERDGLLVATRYSSRPARFDYRLTPDGAALGGAVQLLGAWASARAAPSAVPAHAACGSALEMRWWCPACGLPAPPPGEEQPILA
jgi:DNA-binding HxlR family transcriptional regulator